MNKEELEQNRSKFTDLLKAITLVRKELNIFWYDFITMSIRKGTNIDQQTIFPTKIWWLNIQDLSTSPIKDGK